MVPRFSHTLALLLGLGITATVAAASLRGSSIFPDVAPGSYYDEAIGAMYSAGIIKGYSDGRFGPDEFVTRGQVAVMMQRLRVELGLAVDTGERASSSSRSRRSTASLGGEDGGDAATSSSSSFSAASLNPYGTIRFTSPVFTVNEKDGTVTINVVRTGGNQGTVAVEYALEPGTATAPEDYEAAISTLTFQGKSTSVTFSIKINNDTLVEGTETFKIVLRNPTNNAGIGAPSTAEIRILDDETPASSSAAGAVSSSIGPSVGLSALEYTAAENGSSLTITVQRAGGTSGAINVQYATTDGSAKAGSHYSTTNGTLSFSTGETSKVFSIPIMDNGQIDGNRIFKVNLSSPTGVAGLILGTASANVVVHDDEAGTYGSGSLKFSKGTYEGLESDGGVVITVQRSGGARGKVTVNYATSNGTASAGNDYTATSGALTFEEGESSKTFTVPLLYDLVSDGGETVNLLLSGATGGATIVTPSTATLYIY
jgi:hypothetical protein